MLGPLDNFHHLALGQKQLSVHLEVFADGVLIFGARADNHALGLFLKRFRLRFKGRSLALDLILTERSPENVLRVDILNPDHIKKHIVGNTIAGIERVGVAVKDALAHGRFHLLIKHLNDDAAVIFATSASAAGHLNVLSRRDPSKLL